MKRILYPSFIACIMFAACSKNTQYATPPPVPAYVTINGTNYSTVLINNQTWTAINYNGPGGENYNNNSSDTTQGKLYTWAEAQAISLPAGWRLPTQADFTNLMIAIGETESSNGTYTVIGNEPFQLMSTTRWSTTNGTNNLGFNAYPAGVYNQVSANNQQFNGLGTEAVFLSSTASVPNGASPISFLITPTMAQLSNAIVLPTDQASVRFVKGN